MKLNLNFVNKIPKTAKDTEIILLSQKVTKSKEIKQFIKVYNLVNKNLLVKKLFLRDKSKGFQEKSRSSRYDSVSYTHLRAHET